METSGPFRICRVDPKDLGREYESDVIRINSQSGKGGVAFILKQNFGIALPQDMREEVGYLIKGISDEKHSELTPADIFGILSPIMLRYVTGSISRNAISYKNRVTLKLRLPLRLRMEQKPSRPPVMDVWMQSAKH